MKFLFTATLGGLDLQVSATVTPGYGGDSGYSRGSIGLSRNPSPPEPPEAQIEYAELESGDDILPLLSDACVEQLQEQAIEHWEHS